MTFKGIYPLDFHLIKKLHVLYEYIANAYNYNYFTISFKWSDINFWHCYTLVYVYDVHAHVAIFDIIGGQLQACLN